MPALKRTEVGPVQLFNYLFHPFLHFRACKPAGEFL